ncbi:MAG: hypothetical protein H6644_06980 [Caldilineaceae bacterium]|nr:hypothetical protein [Caldilineaceae bacterium]
MKFSLNRFSAIAPELPVLPTERVYLPPMPKSEKVLVAILNNLKDYRIAQQQHWYRIPVSSAEKWHGIHGTDNPQEYQPSGRVERRQIGAQKIRPGYT